MKTVPLVLYIDLVNSPMYGYDAWETGVDCDTGFLRTTFRGKRLPKGWELPKHKLEGIGQLRDFIAGYAQAPFVSKRAYESLRDVVTDCVEFRAIGKLRSEDYYVMNVIRVLDCLDISRSDLWYLTGQSGKVGGIRKYAFRGDLTDMIQETPVFKIPQHTCVIFVSDSFVDVVRKHKLTGVGFEDPNNQGIMKRNCVIPDLPLRS